MLRLLQKRRICAQCSCHIVTFHLLEEPVESNTSLHQYLFLYLLKDSLSFPERPAWSCAILTLCFPTASNYISWLCPAPGPTELLFQQLRTDRKDPGAPNLELQELHLTCPMSCIQNWRADQSFYALSNFAGFRDCNAVNPVKSVTLSVLAIPCWLPSQHVWNSGDAPQISIWESKDYATEEPNAESLQNLNFCPFQRDCKKTWVNSLGNVWHYGIAPLFPSPSSFIQFPCFPINQQKILWLCVLCVDLQVAMQSKARAFSAHLYVSLKHIHREHFSSYSCRFFGSERTLYASEPSHVSEVRPNTRQLMRCISDFWRHLIALALCIWQKQIA